LIGCEIEALLLVEGRFRSEMVIFRFVSTLLPGALGSKELVTDVLHFFPFRLAGLNVPRLH
jgi:hypothetical protein